MLNYNSRFVFLLPLILVLIFFGSCLFSSATNNSTKDIFNDTLNITLVMHSDIKNIETPENIIIESYPRYKKIINVKLIDTKIISNNVYYIYNFIISKY
jgi:hypothetical protein